MNSKARPELDMNAAPGLHPQEVIMGRLHGWLRVALVMVATLLAAGTAVAQQIQVQAPQMWDDETVLLPGLINVNNGTGKYHVGMADISAAPVVPIVVTFTIVNNGASDLDLTLPVTLTGDGAFSITAQPTTPVASGGGTTTFEVSFAPGDYGVKTATVSIANSVASKNPYTFLVAGLGSPAAAVHWWVNDGTVDIEDSPMRTTGADSWLVVPRRGDVPSRAARSIAYVLSENPVAAGDIIHVGKGTFQGYTCTADSGTVIGASYGLATNTLTVINDSYFPLVTYNGGTGTLTKVTVSNANTLSGEAGGIYLSDATVVITECVIKDNATALRGGGMTIRNVAGGDVTVVNNVFQGNRADLGGGGIYVDCPTGDGINITNNTFTNNQTLEAGGGMLIENLPLGTALDIGPDVFTANLADYGGGLALLNCGSFFKDDTTTNGVKGNTFNSNSAVSGGAIYWEASSPTIINNVIGDSVNPALGNIAVNGGGVYCGSETTLAGDVAALVTNNKISLNQAHDGGGLYCGSGSKALITFQAHTETTDVPPAVLTDGYITANIADNGGGIFCVSGSASVIDTNMIYDHTDASIQFGGGIFVGQGADITISNNYTRDSSSIESYIDNNYAAISGGGIYCQANSKATITSNLITDNVAGEAGGGVAAMANSVVSLNSNNNTSMHTCEISGNQAPKGAGLYLLNSGSGTSISGNDFWYNQGTDGAGLYCDQASPSISSCRFRGNTATGFGGAIAAVNLSSPYVGWCEFGYDDYNPGYPVTLRNTAANGGALYLFFSSNITLDHCLVLINEATENGGALYCRSSHPVIVNCTFDGSVAGTAGGALYSIEGGEAELRNCILWANTPQEIAFAPTQVPNDVSISYCDVNGDEAGILTNGNGIVHWGEGNIALDPLYVVGDWYHRLQSQGGHRLWATMGNPYPRYLADAATSPCVDGGDPNDAYGSGPGGACVGAPPAGQEANWQTYGEEWPNGWRIDMGHYGGTTSASRTLSTITLLLETEPVLVPEGSSFTVRAKLNNVPIDSFSVELKADVVGNDPDLLLPVQRTLAWWTVTEAYQSDFATYKALTLTAREDADTDEGSAVLYFDDSAFTNTNPMTDRLFTAQEVDDDVRLDIRSTTGGQTLPSGTVIADIQDDMPYPLVAVNASGYQFIRWDDPDGKVANPAAASTNLSTTVDTTVTAIFQPTLRVSDLAVGEAAGTAQIQVVLSGATDTDVTVSYSILPDTATFPDDYNTTGTQTLTGAVSWAAGIRGPQTIYIDIVDGPIDEPVETFKVELSNAQNAVIADGSGLVSITDNDPQPTITVDDLTVPEGGTTANVKVHMNGESAFVRSVFCETLNTGTAIAGYDFILTSATLTWPALDSTDREFPVTILNDILQQPDHTVDVKLSVPVNCTIDDAAAVVTITDNDTPLITLYDIFVEEADAPVTVTVTMTNMSTQNIMVDYATADGTATVGGNDYTATAGTLTWLPYTSGDKTVNVTIKDDTVAEPDETVLFNLSLNPASPGTAEFTRTQGVITIRGNDTANLSIADATGTEGGVAIVTVTLSNETQFVDGVAVECVFTDETAKLGVDYDLGAGAQGPNHDYLVFTWGVAEFGDKTATVNILDDTYYDPGEIARMRLRNAHNADIARAQAPLTIINTDPNPSVAVADAAVNEQDGSATVTVTLSGVANAPVTVDYATADVTATAGADYTARTGTLTWPADTQGDLYISVPILNDTQNEGVETFTVTLSNVSANATIGTAVATTTINDNDGNLTVADVSAAENGGDATVTVTLDGWQVLGSSVDYATSDGTATAPGDYAPAAGTLTWAPAEMGDKTFTITLNDDVAAEDDETIVVTLANAVRATIADATATVTILDDDTPVLSIADVAVGEGVGATMVTATMTGTSTKLVTVNWAITGGNATNGVDYTAAANGTFTWPIGTDGGQDIAVTITDEGLIEGTETVTFALSGEVNVRVVQRTATLTITDNDGTPTLALDAIADVTEGTPTASVSVTLTPAVEGPCVNTVAVDYATSNGTATAGEDYAATTGTLAWGPGVSGAKTFTIPLTDDDWYDSAETVNVTLSNPQFATITTGARVLNLLDNDVLRALSITGTTVVEGQNALVTVAPDGKNQFAMSVNYATSDGTALAGVTADYLAASGTLNWAAMNTDTKIITITTCNDLIFEYQESFTVSLNTPVNATIGTASATVIINDEDAYPIIEVTAPEMWDAGWENPFNQIPVPQGLVYHMGLSDYGDPLTVVFTIGNVGTADLLMQVPPAVVLTGDAEFEVTQPATLVVAGDTVTFSITCTPTKYGLLSTDVSIISNDPFKSPYTFTVTCLGSEDSALTEHYWVNDGTVDLEDGPMQAAGEDKEGYGDRPSRPARSIAFVLGGEVIHLGKGTFQGYSVTGGTSGTIMGAAHRTEVNTLSVINDSYFPLVTYDTAGGTLSNVTVSNANTLTAPAGGIYLYNASATITECLIKNNVTAGHGGGMTIFYQEIIPPGGTGGGNVTVTGNTFESNRADLGGGGLYFDCSYLDGGTVSGNTFINNETLAAGGGMLFEHLQENLAQVLGPNNVFTGNLADSGAGLAMVDCGGKPEVESSTFTSNSAVNGGGLYWDNCSPYVAWCTIGDYDNPALGNLAIRGGGVYCGGETTLDPLDPPRAMVTENRIARNVAHDGGGIYCASGSTVFIDDNDREQTMDVPPDVFDDEYIYANVADNGAGIYCAQGSASDIQRNWIVGHDDPSIQFGGGIFVASGATASLSHNTHMDNGGFSESVAGIEGNRAAVSGGGVYCQANSTVSFSSNQIWYNEAGESGGGIAGMANSKLTITDHADASDYLIGYNSAPKGGGIYLFNCDPTTSIARCSLWHNRATDGAAIYCDRSSPSISENMRFYDNVATGLGGVLAAVNLSSPSMSGCGFWENQAANGGLVYAFFNSNVYLHHSLATDNAATENGGVMYARSSQPVIVNCSFDRNRAGTAGGVLYLIEGGEAEVRNSILWTNTPQEMAFAPTQVVNDLTVSYCDVKNGQAGVLTNGNGVLHWGEGNLNADPLYVPGDVNYPLQSQGGHRRFTQEGDNPYPRYVMDAVTSPCVDGGDPNDAYGWYDGTPRTGAPPVGQEPTWQNSGEEWPNGWQIDMGHLGGTKWSSRTLSTITLLLEGEPIMATEAGTATVRVSLNNVPIDNFGVELKADVPGNDPDLLLPVQRKLAWWTITDAYQSDFSTWKSLTLSAQEDADTDDGSSVMYFDDTAFTNANPMNDRLFTAQEVDDDIRLDVRSTPGGQTLPSGTVVVDSIDDMPYPVVAINAAGYEFIGWTDPDGVLANPAAASTSLTTPIDATVTAVFRPTLRVTDLAVPESAGTAQIQVVLSGATDTDVTVAYAIQPGSATFPDDYTTTGLESLTGTVSWQAGTRGPQPIYIDIVDDGIDEPMEAFYVTLSNPQNAVVADDSAIVSITDNDVASVVTIDDLTVTEGIGTAKVRLHITGPSAFTRSVFGETLNTGTAIAGFDYVLTSATVSWGPSDNTDREFAVQILNDSLQQPVHTVDLKVSNPANCTIADDTAVLTITDDDVPTITVRDIFVEEADAPATITVTMVNMSTLSIMVDYATADGTATVANGDYTAAAGVLTWLPYTSGDKSVSVMIREDTLAEPDETALFNLVLDPASPGLADVQRSQAVITIRGNDTANLAVLDLSGTEDATAAVTVTLSNEIQFAEGVSVECVFTNETALLGVDYDLGVDAQGPNQDYLIFTWAAGESGAKTKTINILPDAYYDPGETAQMRLRNARNADIAKAQATLTIINANPKPALSIAGAAVNEQDGSVTLTVTLTGVANAPVTVDYATSDVTATAGADYASKTGTLTWAADTQGDQYVNVAILEDTQNEGAETFKVTLSNVSANATIATADGVVTVTDNDGNLTVADVAAPENGGTATVTVTLDGWNALGCSVDYATADATATAGVDYTTTTGTLTWAPAQMGDKTFTVPLTDDALAEDDETFQVTLSNPVRASISQGTATVTIVDDDTPLLSIADAAITEYDGPAVVTVTMTGTSTKTVTVNWAITGGNATIAVDYMSAANGTFTWLPTTTGGQNIPVTIANDALVEGTETVLFALSAEVNGRVVQRTATLAINDDDGTPTLSVEAIADVSESAGVATVAVTLTNAIAGPCVNSAAVDYATSNGTATAGEDYTATTGTLTWAPAEAGTKTFTIPVLDDDWYDGPETVNVTLANPQFATIVTGTQALTILDNDAVPALTITGVTVTEGQNAVLTVTPDRKTQLVISVNYATSNGTALSGALRDYLSKTGTVTWPVKSVDAKTITITTVQDLVFEYQETFTVSLNTPVNATIAAGTATVTINDDDVYPIVAVTAPEMWDDGWEDPFNQIPVPQASVYHMGTTKFNQLLEVDFTITNAGTADLVLDVTPPVTLVGDVEFEVTQPATLLAPGESTTFTVGCKPTKYGVVSTQVTVLSNDPFQSPYTFTLACLGCNDGSIHYWVNDDVVDLEDSPMRAAGSDTSGGWRPSQPARSVQYVRDYMFSTGSNTIVHVGKGRFEGFIHSNPPPMVLRPYVFNVYGASYHEHLNDLSVITDPDAPLISYTSDTDGKLYRLCITGGSTLTQPAAGIYIVNAEVDVVECLIENNRCKTQGGGMTITGASPGLIDGNTFRANWAPKGAGLYCDAIPHSYLQGSLRITNNIFDGNEALDYGGGILFENLPQDNPSGTRNLIDIKNNQFVGNEADWGGGIALLNSGCFERPPPPPPPGYPSVAGIMCNTFTANMAVDGGALYWQNSSPDVWDNNVITANVAINGGGVWAGAEYPGADVDHQTHFLENLVADNDAHDGGGLFCSSGAIFTIEWCAPSDDGGILRNGAVNGGGVYIDTGAIITTFSTLIADNERNVQLGGGVYVAANGTANITESQNWTGIADEGLHRNKASMSGGGLYCHSNSVVSVTDMAIENNEAGQNGGGIAAMTGCRLQVFANTAENKCGIRQNRAPHGGGIYLFRVDPTSLIEYTEVEANEATDGGAVYFEQAGIEVKYCDLYHNVATGLGGAIAAVNLSAPLIYRCRVYDNGAASGGAFYQFFDSNMTVMKTLVTGNTASDTGGAIYCRSAAPRFINGTFDGNVAGTAGGTLFALEGSSVLFNSSILWQNLPQEIAFPATQAANEVSVTFSDVKGGAEAIVTNGNGTVHWSDGSISADPLYVPESTPDPMYRLSSKGGHRAFGEEARWQRYYMDAVTSPCVDAGDPDQPYGYSTGDGLPPADEQPADAVALTTPPPAGQENGWQDFGEEWPNGWRINMGWLGGTEYAERTYSLLTLILDPEPLHIVEDNAATISVKLSAVPIDEFTVEFNKSGSAEDDPDIILPVVRKLTWWTRSELYQSDFGEPKSLTLEAQEDNADAANGMAVIRFSDAFATNVNPMTPREFTALEVDDDVRVTVLSTPGGQTLPSGMMFVDTTDDMPYPVLARSNLNYQFKYWDDPGKVLLSPTSPTTTLTTVADATVTAVFWPTLSVGDATVAEAVGAAEIQVVLNGATDHDVTVDYSIDPGTATLDQDYRTTGTQTLVGTLRWVAGTRGPLSLYVDIIDDAKDEPMEYFWVNLSNAQHADLAKASGAISIMDNDPASVVTVDDLTVAENVGTANVTVHITGDSAFTRSVFCETLTTGTAASGQDFILLTTTLSWGADDTTNRTFPISIFDDNLSEDPETINVRLSVPVNCTIGDADGVVTITDNDTPTITVFDVFIEEADAPATVTVTMTNASTKDIILDYWTADGTALTAKNDYTGVAGTVTWTALTTGDKYLAVPIKDDLISEPDQTVLFNIGLNVASPGTAVITRNQATITIRDNDVSSVSVAEATGTEASGQADITATMSNETEFDEVTVECAFVDQTAKLNEDYDLGASGQGADKDYLIFRWIQGESGDKVVPINVIADGCYDPTETVQLRLRNARNADIAKANATLTITDMDPQPQLTTSDMVVNEGDGSVTVTVTLTNPAEAPVTVNYATSDVTATVNVDYTEVSGTLTWASKAQGNNYVVIPITQDLESEGSESFKVVLSNPVGATLVQDTAVVTIVDDDGYLNVSGAMVDEGAGSVSVTVNLTGWDTVGVSVDYATSDGPATAPADYTATTGTLNWAALETGDKSFAVPIVDDALDEATETFTITLSNAVNGVISTGTSTVSITDNDPEPTLALNNAVIEEYDGPATVTVTMTNKSQSTVTVDWATSDGSATAPADYVTGTGTVSWAGGETGDKTFSVTIVNDGLTEGEEALNLTLSNPVNASITQATGVLTVTDDEPPPALALAALAGVSETAGVATVTVTMTGISVNTVSVTCSSGDGTATAGEDYTAFSNQVTWLAGETGAKSFTVALLDNDWYQGDVTVPVTLSNPQFAVLDPDPTKQTQTLTILDDEALPTLAVAPAAVAEGGTATVSVTLTGKSKNVVSVDYATGKVGDTAVVDTDYTATTGSFSWTAKTASSKTFTVATVNDAFYEVTESFTVVLSNAVNATLATPEAAVTISDDDPLPTVSIADAQADENSGGAQVWVTMTGAIQGDVTVDFATADGTATANRDYVPATTQFKWTSGATGPRAFYVVIVDDELNEEDETVLLNLSNPTNATIVTGQATLTIKDNDQAMDLDVAAGWSLVGWNVRKLWYVHGAAPTVALAQGTPALDQVDLGGTAGIETAPPLASLNGKFSDVRTLDAGGQHSYADTSLKYVGGGYGMMIYTTEAQTLHVPGPLLPASATLDLNSGWNLLTNWTNVVYHDAQFSATVPPVDLPAGVEFAAVGSISEVFASVTGSYVVMTFDAEGGHLYDSTMPELSDLHYLAPGYGAWLWVDHAVTGFAWPAVSALPVPGPAAPADPAAPVHFTGVTPSPEWVSFFGDCQILGVAAEAGDELAVYDGTTLCGAATVQADGSFGFLKAYGYLGLGAKLGADAGATLSFKFWDASAGREEAVLVDVVSGTTPPTWTANGDRWEVDLRAGPVVSVADVTVAENAVTATVTVTMTGTSAANVGVNYTTSDGTATVAGADYTPTLGSLTWLAGTTGAKTFTVGILDDDVYETDETVNVTITLAPAAPAMLGQDTAVITVTNNDSLPTLALHDVNVAESAGTGTVMVTIGGASIFQVQVNYATSNGTATAPADYTAAAGTLTWPAGDRDGKTFAVTIVNDALDEDDETVALALSDAQNANIVVPEATLTILDDDAPVLVIADAPINENAGVVTMTVTMTGISLHDVTVDYATGGGTATADLDYTGTHGQLTWPAGQEGARTFTVTILDDTAYEPGNETFNVTLANPVNATIATATGVVTIVDNDAAPTLSAADVAVDERSGGVTVTVTMSGLAGVPVTVNYETADGTAKAGADYVSKTGSLLWNPGTTGPRSLAVTVTDDGIGELDETFLVNLKNPSNATLARATATVTIRNDDYRDVVIYNGAFSETSDGDSDATTVKVSDLLICWFIDGELQPAASLRYWKDADGKYFVRYNNGYPGFTIYQATVSGTTSGTFSRGSFSAAQTTGWMATGQVVKKTTGPALSRNVPASLTGQVLRADRGVPTATTGTVTWRLDEKRTTAANTDQYLPIQLLNNFIADKLIGYGEQLSE